MRKPSGRTARAGQRLAPALCWAALSALAAGQAQGAEYYLDPSVRLKGEYNDNIRLTPQPHGDVFGFTLSPELHGGVRQERWAMEASYRLDAARYSNKDEAEDRNNQFVDFSAFLQDRAQPVGPQCILFRSHNARRRDVQPEHRHHGLGPPADHDPAWSPASHTI